MHLRLYANAHNLERRVVVPADAVDTFDILVDVARQQGSTAHDGDLHHLVFLHHSEILANISPSPLHQMGSQPSPVVGMVRPTQVVRQVGKVGVKHRQ